MNPTSGVLGPGRIQSLRAYAARNATPEARAVRDLLAIVDDLTRPAMPNPLTTAEMRSLAAYARCADIRSTALLIGRSEDTVRTQLRRARQRLHLDSTHQLLAAAFANGWLTRSDLKAPREQQT